MHAGAVLDDIYRRESRRVLATLIRLLGDFDLAEEALSEAFRAALEQAREARRRQVRFFVQRGVETQFFPVRTDW